MQQSVTFPDTPLSGELELNLPPGCRCAVVVSHDIDHLGFRDHIVDWFLARYLVQVTRSNLLHRFRPLNFVDSLWGVGQAIAGHDRWDTIDEVLRADLEAGVPATWFVAVRNGLGIAYGTQGAKQVVRQLQQANVEIGLHGQSAHDAGALTSEVRELSEIVGAPIQGLRMHYLRLTPQVYDGAAAAGIRYDSTVLDREHPASDESRLKGPRLVRPTLVEIPLHVMDSTLFSTLSLGLTTEQAIDYVRRVLGCACDGGRIVVINHHPNYYSRQNRDMRSWYDAILKELTSRSDLLLTDFRGLLSRIRLP
jgi:hypothetical protein